MIFLKEIQIILPSDRKTLMDEFIKEFSLSATSYDFGEAFRYELTIDNYQTNMLICSMIRTKEKSIKDY